MQGRKSARRLARYRRLYHQRPLVAVSEGVAADMRDHFSVPAQQIRVIPNPFDFSTIRSLAAQPCLELPATPYILHVGRYVAQKRHDLLFSAYAALVRSGVTYPLVLLTNPSAQLNDAIVRHGIEKHTFVAGFQPNPYPWMAHAELLVLCSDHEGLPNVLIEALACGARVVSTDCPSGPREILRGELACGLVPCGDAVALAQGMRTLLEQPRPSPESVAMALQPFEAQRVLAAWEALAKEMA